MQNEYVVLDYLKNNYQTSQREIAENTGLSVGTVNLLIRKIDKENGKKGFIKLERINGRTLRYILTPKDMAEKARLTYAYLKISYQKIIKINNALAKVVNRHKNHGSTPVQVIFYGPQDEVLEMLKTAAADQGINYTITSDPGELQNQLSNQKSPLVVTWAVNSDHAVPEGTVVVNVLEEM
ncbi:winged helix-turn-helix transcriptional regulator [Peptococcaceae bacterium]|nr:winged helix-turn-helix transcriptional regulator [Peptococcaceae bacterium]